MDVGYDSETGVLAIAFTPRDIRDYALLFQLVLEEEMGMGTCVPNFSKDFFRKFSDSSEKVTITFDCEYLEFCVIFLEEVWMEMIDDGDDTSIMERFLEHVVPLCADNSVLHYFFST